MFARMFSQKPTLGIQGFGNVGENLARLAHAEEYGYLVLAVSDKNGGLYAENGLDIPAVRNWMRDHRTIVGYPHAQAISNTDTKTRE